VSSKRLVAISEHILLPDVTVVLDVTAVAVRPIDCKKALFRFKRAEGLGEVKSKSDSLVQ
jgi:hypothetical protein